MASKETMRRLCVVACDGRDAEHQEVIVRPSFCPMRQMSGIVNVFEWFRDCSACRVRGKLVYNRVLEYNTSRERSGVG